MNQFKKLLIDIKEATSNQKEKELWDIEGILHNQKFKFDLRPLKNNSKGGSFKTKADKIVYDIKGQYILSLILQKVESKKALDMYLIILKVLKLI